MNSTINILKNLIKIPSYFDGNNNEEKIKNYIKNIFVNSNYVVEEQIIDNGRSNLIISNSKNPKIILFGHMDTVLPQYIKNKNVFSPKIIGDKLYGLGSVDMKSGLAIMINQALVNKKEGLALIFTSDEEYCFKGALKLIEIYKYNPKLIINIEPTNLKILNGCRGITEFSFNLIGKSCHASVKKLGTNAIEKAVDLVNILEKELNKLDTNDVRTSINLSYLHGGNLQVSKDGNNYISDLGMIVPNFAKVNCEIRIGNQKITKDIIKNNIDIIAKKIGIEIKDLEFKFFLNSMFTSRDKIKDFENIAKDYLLPVEYLNINNAGFYEVQIIQQKFNTPCVIFGPGPMEKAHTQDEYVSIETIEKAEKVINSFIKKTFYQN